MLRGSAIEEQIKIFIINYKKASFTERKLLHKLK
jgi:hypothetical protein